MALSGKPGLAPGGMGGSTLVPILQWHLSACVG
uniref:Uncharacterized protein n=1 Tax=Anguilla anguilla TaxID=7936 RepID=A0A0E9TRD4_ANGAN